MLKEALQYLAELTGKASTPVDLSSQLGLTDPRQTIVAIDGRLEHIYSMPPQRSHAFESIDDIVAFANRFRGATTDAEPEYNGAVVWLSKTAIECQCNDFERIDGARLALTQGSQFEALTKHREGLNQARFVRFLRVCLNLPDPIVAPFRRLDWTTNTTGETYHGASKMGKSIEAASNGTDKLPEHITLEMPVYAYQGATIHVIRCRVDVDTLNQTLQLVAEPDALNHAIEAAQTHILQTLRGGLVDTIPIYRGTP